mmetsp:Transcript_28752/g.92578  ORF Transcript_28752/g.92578 Transcript_28752/m.92578 type:complete len:619 (-) Transcript_28752:98-1954(-)
MYRFFPTRRGRSNQRHCDYIFFALLLQLSVEAGWIDPDSPLDAQQTRSYTADVDFRLVFSDEFEVPGRRFHDGLDPRWTAVDKNDYTNKALHYYHRDHAETSPGGYLNITTAAVETKFTSKQVVNGTVKRRRLKKKFRSGMIQTWNKFCFTGGVVQVRAKLPGEAKVGGLWPALWLMGNLARSTYVESSDCMWPWSYDKCSREHQKNQEINACKSSPHFGLHSHQGRGAPEIDILEAMPGSGVLPWGITKPYFSTSLQIAPGKTVKRPNNGDRPRPGSWYEGINYGENSSINVFFYGMKLSDGDESSYQADALSGNTPIDADYFDDFHVYRLEWEPPSFAKSQSRRNIDGNITYDHSNITLSANNKHSSWGYLRWYLDARFVYGIEGAAMRKLMGSKIPDEPAYVLLNTAISSTWGFPVPCPTGCDCDCFDCFLPGCTCAFHEGFCESLPAHFLIDYVRIYQGQGSSSAHTVGCSTDTHPTRKFIDAHRSRYVDPDLKAGVPLRPVTHGGGACEKDEDCRGHPLGSTSRCTRSCVCGGLNRLCLKTCHCSKTTTGPNCLATPAADDIDLDTIVSATTQQKFVKAIILYLPPSLRRLGIVLIVTPFALVILNFRRRASY